MKKISLVLIVLVSCSISWASEYQDSYESDMFSPSAEEYLFDSSEMASLTIDNLDEIMEDLAKEPSPRRSMKIATMDVDKLVANLESMDPSVADDALQKMSKQQELYTKVLNKVDEEAGLPDDWYAKEEYNIYARLKNQREREFEELIKKHKEREAQLPKKKLSPRLKRMLLAAKKIKNGRIKDEKVSPRSAMVGGKALSLLGEEEIG